MAKLITIVLDLSRTVMSHRKSTLSNPEPGQCEAKDEITVVAYHVAYRM